MEKIKFYFRSNSNKAFNVIGNLVLFASIYYTFIDSGRKNMTTFDLYVGYFGILILLIAHTALIVESVNEWKKR